MDAGQNVPEKGEVLVTTQTNTTASTTPSTRYVESVRALLVAVALAGSIALAMRYEAALTPTLVLLGGVVGGYFGVSQNKNPSA